MKKYILLTLLLSAVLTSFGQKYGISTDIFDNLIYTTRDGNYTAKLSTDIFDNLVFTDSRENKVHFDKAYLDREYPNMPLKSNLARDFFMDLIRQYRKEHKYQVSYKVDIFDKLTVTDNRGYKLEKEIDIFGNENVKEEVDGVASSIKRNLHGNLEYQSGNQSAVLKKDIFDKWRYEDSQGNIFQFSPKTWRSLIDRYGTDKEVFLMIIDEFFF